MLSDLEFRVWSQYQLSADSFGVMRFSALQIQNDHAALERRPQKAIAAALEALVTVHLVESFQHQAARFICQLDWQDFQKRKFAKRTNLPKPPNEILERCSPWTRFLFQFHPGGVTIPKFLESFQNYSQNPPGILQESLEKTSPSREIHTHIQTLTLTRSTNTEGNSLDAWLDRFAREHYPPEGYQAGWEVEQAWIAAFDGEFSIGRWDELCAAAAQHKRSIQWREGKIPLLGRWLKEKRWNQRLPEPDTAPKGESAAEILARRKAQV